MNSRSIRSLFTALAAALFLWCGVARGEEAGGKGARARPEKAPEKGPEKPQVPGGMDPVQALQTALTNLAKAESYRTAVFIEGGISDREDHQVTERSVRETYEGEVFGTLMHVPEAKAYRYPRKGGVAFLDGTWKNILSDMKTKRLERLFAFPEIILGRALSHAPKSGRWLTPEEEKERGLEDDGEASDEVNDPDDEDWDEGDESDAEETALEPEPAGAPEQVKGDAGPSAGKPVPGKSSPARASPEKGKTVAIKPGSGTVTGPAPRVVRVEAPPQEALTHFLEVEKSGCMSEG